jgi:outer membrane protein
MSQEYNRLTEEYEAKKDQLTDLLKQNKQKEIMSVAERMQAFDRQSQISIQEKQVELMNVIVEKIKTAVAEVAAENGYTYIFESNGILWYAAESDDITSLLEKKLSLN